MRRTPQRRLWTLATWVLAACASQDEASSHACTVVEAGRYSLSMNGTDVYVEPHFFAPTEQGYVLAGAPTYEWLVDSAGRGSQVGAFDFLGVEVRGEQVTPIPLPDGVGHVAWVRGVPLGADAWGFLLEEVEDRHAAPVRVERVMYGEYRGGRWSPLEVLTAPGDGRFTVADGSSLIASRDGESLHWATLSFPASGRIDVVLFTRTGDGWTAAVAVPDWADAVDLAVGPDGTLRLAVGGLDPEFQSTSASIRVFAEEDGWTPHRLSTPTASDRFRTPRLTMTNGRLDLAWLQQEEAGSTAAWLARDVDSTSANRQILIDRSVTQLSSVLVSERITLWLTHHINGISGAQELRFHESGPDFDRRIASVDGPFRGPFAAILSGDELLVVGPEVNAGSTHPFVRSLVLRMTLSCA